MKNVMGVAFFLMITGGCHQENKSEYYVGEDFCGDWRSEKHVYNGTTKPSHIPLSLGQQMAIGSVGGYCSGTLVKGDWVVTAKHCKVKTGHLFCTGYRADERNLCTPVAEVFEHADNDLAILRLETDLTETGSADISPISLLEESIEDRLGDKVELAGYGQTETGGSGTRLFAAEPIVAISGKHVTVDGEGETGACFGDSGGPLLTLAKDGSARLAGALENGAASCLGRDNYTRVDNNRDWILAYTGPMKGQTDCGGFTEEGRCYDGQNVYCSPEGKLVAEPCSEECGWSVDDDGFRCIAEGTDPCDGVDGFGTCEENAAVWCENGKLMARDCGCAGMKCEEQASKGGAYCVDDPCEGIDFQGTCQGDMAMWCKDGQLEETNCAERGQQCGWVDESTGFYCE